MPIHKNPFHEIDSTKVYARVLSGLDSTGRSLWRRIESELKTSGVSGVKSYLSSEFRAVVENIEERLRAFEEVSSTSSEN